jgi:hypothetical protein
MINRHDELKLDSHCSLLKNKFFLDQLSINEEIDFYNRVIKLNNFFPYEWEEKMLLKNIFIKGLNYSSLARLDHLNFFSCKLD